MQNTSPEAKAAEIAEQRTHIDRLRADLDRSPMDHSHQIWNASNQSISGSIIVSAERLAGSVGLLLAYSPLHAKRLRSSIADLIDIAEEILKTPKPAGVIVVTARGSDDQTW